MKAIWNIVFIQPITQSLLYFTELTGSLGWGIVILTLLIQVLLTPLRLPSLKSAEKMKVLKPKLDELKEKHKEKPQELLQAQMALYKEHGVSPFGGILPMLLSFPIIFALYAVLQDIVGTYTGGIEFLWLNLTQPDQLYILPVVVAATQWLLIKMSSMSSSPGGGGEDMAQMMQKNMQFIFPITIGIITLRLPSGVGIYFVVSAVFAIMQQIVVKRWLQNN